MEVEVESTEWLEIESAPKDGRIIEVCQYPYASVHAFYKNGWHVIEFQGPSRITHWRAHSPN